MQTAILENYSIRKMVLPITVEQYHRLGEAGIIGEKIELLNGVIIEKMPKSPEHTYVVRKLYELLGVLILEKLFILKEDPLTLVRSEPEPDLAIVQGNKEEYKFLHPTTALLVIEVALSSIDIDREKASIYAEANIPEYWLFDLNLKQVEVFSKPHGDSYQKKKIYNISDNIPLKIVKGGNINLKGVF